MHGSSRDLIQELTAPAVLLEALRKMIPGASNRTLRRMLAEGRVLVGGVPCKIAGRALRAGDEVRVGPKRGFRLEPEGIEVVHQDPDVLVILKPAGLLTVATEHERERTVHSLLRKASGRGGHSGSVQVVHRLDKFVSGLLVFARSDAAREALKTQFMKHTIVRKYWAVVEGSVAKPSGTIASRLVEGSNLRVRSVAGDSEGKRAVTHYKVLRRLRNETLLEVTLETGRKNQIRVHMSEMGHPIVGDRNYGSQTDPLGRIALHAHTLGFTHPRTGERLLFESEPPAGLRGYFRR